MTTEEKKEDTLSPENRKILEELKVMASKGDLIGECKDIPNEVYHHIECPGYSKTGTDKIDKSFAHYKYAKENFNSTPALEFGCAFHDMILEPPIFVGGNIQGSLRPDKEVPKFGRKAADKEEKKRFMDLVYEPWRKKVQVPWDERNGQKKMWSDKDWGILMGMKKAISEHEFITALMKDAEFEVTYFWIDKKTGILCKCRPDIINKSIGIIADLKSTMDASPKDFRKSIANFKYDKQASYYLTGVNEALGTNFETFIFVACEKSAPFEIALYNLDEASIDVGKLLWERSLEKIVNIKKGKLPKGYLRAIQNINLPAYAFDIEAR